MTTDEVLNALVATLEQLRRTLPDDKATWNDEVLVRLAVERLWITAGNLAEGFRIDRGMAPGVEPWSELAGYRHLLAHALPGDLSSDRVFADSVADLGRILAEVRAVNG
ncbi:MAG: hypothetical protein ACRDRT_03435 [Pseudonocardiaceae bacterium]